MSAETENPDDQKLDPKTEAMLARCMSRFLMATALYRMGLGGQIPLREGPTDEEYQRALEQPEEPDDEV